MPAITLLNKSTHIAMPIGGFLPLLIWNNAIAGKTHERITYPNINKAAIKVAKLGLYTSICIAGVILAPLYNMPISINIIDAIFIKNTSLK